MLGQQHSLLMVRLCPNPEHDFPFFEQKNQQRRKSLKGNPLTSAEAAATPSVTGAMTGFGDNKESVGRSPHQSSTQIHKWGGTPSFPDVYFCFMDSFSPGFPRENISRPAVSGSLPCGIAPSICFFFSLFIFNQRITALQCWVGFYQTSISTSHTYVPSFLNLEPIIQSEINQKEKNKYILTHIYRI